MLADVCDKETTVTGSPERGYLNFPLISPESIHACRNTHMMNEEQSRAVFGDKW